MARKPVKRNLKRINSQMRNSKGIRNRFRKKSQRGFSNREKNFIDKYIDGELEQPKALDMFCCTSGGAGGDTSSFTPCPKGFFCARNCKCMVDNGE